MVEQKPLSLKRSLYLMSGITNPQKRSVLRKLHTPSVPKGYAYYVMPGGYVTEETANLIKKRPDVRGDGDGLLPEHDQTWRLG